MPISPQAKPIEIKISTIVAVSAILHSTDMNALDAALKKMTGGTPDFFEDDLAVIDEELNAGTADPLARTCSCSNRARSP